MLHKNNNKSIYTKDMSKMMAGIAIMTMTFMHLFHHPEWLSNGVTWHSLFGNIGDEITWILSKSCAVFFFSLTSGYVLYANTKAYSTMKSRIMRLLRFLVSYWIVFALFLLIGVLNNDTMPTPYQLALNMFGLHTGPLKWVNVPFAWYVIYYIEFILLVPILLWLYKGKDKVKDAITTICIAIFILFVIPIISEMLRFELICEILESSRPLISTCIGIVFAKYYVFDKVHQFLNKLPMWSILLFIVGIYIIWHALVSLGLSQGIEYVLKIILMSLFLELLVRLKSTRIKQLLSTLGKYSLYLWFLHGIFFTGKNFLQRELYSLSDPLLIMIVCIACLLPIAHILDMFVSWIFSFTKREYAPVHLAKNKP
jgi:hypothetical protein